MTFDYGEKGVLNVRMERYMEKMISEFPGGLKKTDVALTPAGQDLFDKGDGKALNNNQREIFHTMVAKGLFIGKRARGDILQVISVLASRVQDPNKNDWGKLIRMLKYLNGTKKRCLRVSIDDIRVLKWYVDASFAVHPDFKSHTGASMIWGQGSVANMSRKQKLNTRSSTEAELVAVDDAVTMILWTKLFLEEQGYSIEKNVLYQDNKSAILLETNGRKSAGKRSRALNVRYFFVTDQIDKGNLTVEYCPTDAMFADFFTKPLSGDKFRKFRDIVLGS